MLVSGRNRTEVDKMIQAHGNTLDGTGGSERRRDKEWKNCYCLVCGMSKRMK